MLAKVDKKTMSVENSTVFVNNVYSALNVVSMPTSKKDFGQFLCGAFEQSCSHSKVDKSNEEHSDGYVEGSEDGPPKAKRIRREMKSIKIKSLQVCW